MTSVKNRLGTALNKQQKHMQKQQRAIGKKTKPIKLINKAEKPFGYRSKQQQKYIQKTTRSYDKQRQGQFNS